jgi:hypothetical protein
MDLALNAAARALEQGEVLDALRVVALRDDPPALALRGIALAQLGELERARELLRSARRGFGTEQKIAQARCAVAEAEIALASRDLQAAGRALSGAAAVLEAGGDRGNALYARCLEVRRLLLLGRCAKATELLDLVGSQALPARLRVVAELARAELELRALRTKLAEQALNRAASAARRAKVPALVAEVERARSSLEAPVARCIEGGEERPLRLRELERVYASDALVVDALRHEVREVRSSTSLARRPILFALARALAEVWPEDAARDALIARAFETSKPNSSHRARLRVEMARLRRALSSSVEIQATPRGFLLLPKRAREVVVLAPPGDSEHARLLALLSDGESWSSSALSLAASSSQRSVQRALQELEAQGKVHAVGLGRARRWLASPAEGFAPLLLLPGPLPVE